MPHKINPIDFENSEGNLGVHCRHTLYFSVCPFASEQYCGARPPPSDSARAPLPFRRPRQPSTPGRHDQISVCDAKPDALPSGAQTDHGGTDAARTRARARTLPLALQRTSGSAR